PAEAGVGRPERVHHGLVRDVATPRTISLASGAGGQVVAPIMPPTSTGKQDPLALLSRLLRTALDLTADLARDSHLPRLLAAFARFPATDRRALIEKLESEVHARQRSLELGDGQVGPPHPLASLYIRVYENDRPLPEVTRDTMLRSTIQSTALMTRFPERAGGGRRPSAHPAGRSRWPRRPGAGAPPPRSAGARRLVRAHGVRAMIRERRVSPVDAVDALDTLLGTAMRVIDQLRAEGLLERLVALLACMLPEDRESIVRILEHDADAHTQLGEG